MRKNIIAGNWKMNKTCKESDILLQNIKNSLVTLSEVNNTTRVLVAPTFVNLQFCLSSVKNTKIEVIAQNVHQEDKGAFTGEVSARMLLDIGVKTVIIGHSERREYFSESNYVLRQKVTNALENGLEVIFCFGESLQDRENGNYFRVIEKQLEESVFNLSAEHFEKIILAYEPIWAIGTGKTASASEAQEVHAFVRQLLTNKYNDTLSQSTSILYGGSVKPTNAKEIFSKIDVDGGLIGGASLNANDFVEIIKAVQ